MTSAFGGQRSIQLSYGCLKCWAVIGEAVGAGNVFVRQNFRLYVFVVAIDL